MNKKICIATPVDYSNFGNRLQNYAVHVLCKRMGMEPTTLAVEYAFVFGRIPKNRILKLIDKLHLGILLSRVDKLKSINKSYASWKFTQSEIKTVYIENEEQLDRILSENDFYGIGGDQILAPFWKRIIRFAMFRGCDADRKICFSPSFGSDSLPDAYLNEIRPELEEIGHMAVREQSGCGLARKAAGIEAVRICDPVVMLTQDEWKAAAVPSKVTLPGRSAVAYFLGDFQQQYQDFISHEIEKNQCSIIDVSKSSKSKEAACNPLEFVSYLEQAECIYTDSFHAVMLAIILNKRVVIFERAGGREMNTRILELVARYHLENCLYSEEKNDENLGKYNVCEANAILDRERDLANEYYKQFV